MTTQNKVTVYDVHRVSRHRHPTPVILGDGTKTLADVETLEVELVPVGGQSKEHGGTVKLAYQGELLIAAAKTIFVQGQRASATWDFVPAPAEAPADKADA